MAVEPQGPGNDSKIAEVLADSSAQHSTAPQRLQHTSLTSALTRFNPCCLIATEQSITKQFLEHIISTNSLLAEIRSYRFDGLALSMTYKEDNCNMKEFSVKQMKAGKFIARNPLDEEYEVLLRLVRWVRVGQGYCTASEPVQPLVAYILARHYARIPLKVPGPLTPLVFALCCRDIYRYCDQRLLHSVFIRKHMGHYLKALNQRTNLTDEHRRTLAAMLLDEHGKPKVSTNGKNEALVDFLRDQHAAYYPEYVVRFCELNTEKVRKEVRRMFPAADFAKPKSAHRIQEKFQEYATDFLQPGVHVYRRFKDLFRARISYEDFMKACPNGEPPPEMKLSSYSSPPGDYCAGYVILNVFSLNVELKIVENMAKEAESYEWYELARSNTLENLEDFIRRRIKHTHYDVSLPS